MTFSSTGKAAYRITQRPALSLPLLGGLPDEDVDIERAALCEHDDKREPDDGHGPNCYVGSSIMFLSTFQLIELGLTYLYDIQVPPFVAVASGTALFCSASVFYNLSIPNNHAALAPKGWMNVVFTAVFLVHLVLSALFLLHLALTSWMDSAEETPMFVSIVQAASLFCAASVMYKRSLKRSPIALVPDVWLNVVCATALLDNAVRAFQMMMLGTIFMSLAVGIFSSTTFSIRSVDRNKP
jgi:hypothetical protein